MTERLNVKPKGSHMQKVPPRKKRLEKQIKEVRANLSKLQEWQKGSLKKEKEKDQLNRMYKVNQKGLSVATEEVTQTTCSCQQGFSGMKPDINSGDRISCSKQTRSNSIKNLMGKKRLNRQFQMQQYPENSGVTCGTNVFNTPAMLSG